MRRGWRWTIWRKRRRCIRGCIGDGAEGKRFNTEDTETEEEKSMRRRTVELAVVLVAAMSLASPASAGELGMTTETNTPATAEGEFVAKDFRFRDGGRLAELRLHYATLGKPARDENGRVTNAVMLLHGTGGSGAQFLQPQFAGELFGAGQLLDAAKYYIILPDGIGHGKSSKPSDGLHAKFRQYDYDDMVAAHHALLEHLGVEHLRLILGTSMGCMHAFVWGETYPEFMDALMPLACQPAQIAGRNPGLDANDLLYQVNASRNYDPLPGLEKIRARMMYVNSADDFINPPELGIAEREIRRVAGAKFVVIPISDATHGHGTHTWAAVWKGYLAELLAAK